MVVGLAKTSFGDETLLMIRGLGNAGVVNIGTRAYKR